MNEPLNIPLLIFLKQGVMKLPALFGIIKTQDRETYQPTSIMRWDNRLFAQRIIQYSTTRPY
jgi:hypothetical protein